MRVKSVGCGRRFFMAGESGSLVSLQGAAVLRRRRQRELLNCAFLHKSAKNDKIFLEIFQFGRKHAPKHLTKV